MSSERSSDNESVFEYDDEAIEDVDDKASQGSQEENDLMGGIVDMENKDENVYDDEDK